MNSHNIDLYNIKPILGNDRDGDGCNRKWRIGMGTSVPMDSSPDYSSTSK